MATLTQDVLRQKPTGGAVFAFRGRRGDRYAAVKARRARENGYDDVGAELESLSRNAPNSALA
ncbi:hypothetical protein NKH56_36440 [Mesorhizobium sp. M1076]